MEFTQPTRQTVVAVRNVNQYLGQSSLRSQVLYDINLEIKAGEIIIMTGPSGSGKTTLLTLIGGLRSVQEGSLKVLGKELHGASNEKLVKVRRRIGYIFQSHNLLDFLTARQNVQMSLEMHKGIPDREARIKSEAILHAVNLGNRVNYYPPDLSGGQKQRVAIARALVNRPQLVLADEPTAALDSKSGRDAVELMQRLAKEQGCAVLIVTHDNRILDIAERIIHMEDGRLCQEVMC
jgi:putative ABC transport system ATP-binding protein